MTVKSLKIPTVIIEKLITSCNLPKENRSESIRRGLADFLLLPLEEQVVNEDALEKLLTVEEELECQKISVRFPDDLLAVVEKLAGEKNISETITWMLARILYKPLNTANTKCTERLLYVLGNKWNPEMQKAIQHIAETADTAWDNSVETCVGGLGIFTNVEFAQNQVINDNDWNKANLLKVIRDYPREFIAGARALEVNKHTFDMLKDCKVAPSKSPNIAAAVRFLYLNLNSVLGQCECIDNDTTTEKYWKRLGLVYPLHLRLQNVEIHDKDIFDILKKFHKTDNTVFIIDPPYLGTSGYEKRIVRNAPSYGMTFGLNQHQKLARSLRKIKQGGNDFIYFCRVTATRHKDKDKKQCKNSSKELAKMDRALQREIGRLYFGFGFYYTDVNTQSDGTIERIITSFNFEGATEYGSMSARHGNPCTLPLAEMGGK